MGLLRFFKKSGKTARQAAAPPSPNTLEEFVGAGMRVEVATMEGRLLFAAKLTGVHRGRGKLVEYAGGRAVPHGAATLQVKIRGYNEQQEKAVHMEGFITPQPGHVWKVESLRLLEVSNNRAFFRMKTDLDGTVTSFTGMSAGERPCKLLNISVGGVRIRADRRYRDGDKFLLKVKLGEDRDPSTIFCQVLRTVELEGGGYEYGCRFLELSEADEAAITQSVYMFQRKTHTRT